jgi:hypothetical protein
MKDNNKTKFKLKSANLKEYRENSIEAQDGICTLCERELYDAVQDHDHDLGFIRNSLCRACNSLEGKIVNATKRFGKGIDKEIFLENLVKYWKTDFSHNPIHPTHKTELDKEIRSINKKIKSAKMTSTIIRLKAARKELKAQIIYYDMAA